MAWDLSNGTRNRNLPLKKAWGIYTPQRRKIVVGPRGAPVRSVPHTGQTDVEKLVVGASGTGQTGHARDTPKTLSMKLALHHKDEIAQVGLGGFVSTLTWSTR
jgi:hypothetical protein